MQLKSYLPKLCILVLCLAIGLVYYLPDKKVYRTIAFNEENQPIQIPSMEWSVLLESVPDYRVNSIQLKTNEVDQNLLDFVVKKSKGPHLDPSVYRIDYCPQSEMILIKIGSYTNENLRIVYCFDLRKGLIIGRSLMLD